jgi:thiamine-phosphate pyrophosphorylase
MNSLNPFQLFVITSSENFLDEEKYLTQFFDLGASGVYIRKDCFSAEYLTTAFNSIKSEYYSKIFIPFSVNNVSFFQKFNPVIHFKEKDRTSENLSMIPSGTVLSTSIHDIDNWGKLSEKFHFAFYSPVYESISKMNYKPKIAFERLPTKIKKQKNSGKILPKLIALGGINERNVSILKDVGFDGAAMLGSIWKSADPAKAFEKIKLMLG